MLLLGSSVDHSMVAVESVLAVTVGGEVMTGGIVSGGPFVVKLTWLDVVGPFPDKSIDPTRK